MALFRGELTAWRVAFLYAADHFPAFGAGINGPQLSGVFRAYFPNAPIFVAHSIYFWRSWVTMGSSGWQSTCC